MVALLSSTERLRDAFKRPPIRSMRQFAEDEIYLPTGKYRGMRFKCSRQPFTRLWFDEVDSGRWSEFVALGPSQSGKSLDCFVIPICYHLFEMRETVIAAVPDREMIRDKWEDTIAPVIERTRYRHLMPLRGAGSKGGTSMAHKFQHGPVLRWMTAGGSDKARSNYTSRVVCMTESDGFDLTMTTSDEGTKIDQIKARMQSHDRRSRRFYAECTVSRDTKFTWNTYDSSSSRSRIVLPCPHCTSHVLPERENLKGWKQAKDEFEAAELAFFECPTCKTPWSDEDRWEANKRCKILHGEQAIGSDGDSVLGDLPKTRTLGFRWTAVHNMFLPTGDFGVDEYLAPRSKTPDLAERKLLQFVFALPVTDDIELIDLSVEQVQTAVAADRLKGAIPNGAIKVSVGVDVGKRWLDWVIVARMPDGSTHVCDYGRTAVPFDDYGDEEEAFKVAFAALYETLGTVFAYNIAIVDIRYLPEKVIAAVKESCDKRWHYHIGLGDDHYTTRGKKYVHPDKKSKDHKQIGSRYYVKRRERGARVYAIHSDACYWKTRVQQGFFRFHDESDNRKGVFTLYESTDVNEHVEYGQHITAERLEDIFEPEKGNYQKWVTISRSNHKLDATYMGLVGLEYQPKKIKVEVRPALPQA